MGEFMNANSIKALRLTGALLLCNNGGVACGKIILPQKRELHMEPSGRMWTGFLHEVILPGIGPERRQGEEPRATS